MEGNMKVAVMNGIGKMGYTERPIPVPKDDEVLVKTGICRNLWQRHALLRDGKDRRLCGRASVLFLDMSREALLWKSEKTVTHLKVATVLPWSREKHAASANFAEKANIISVRMLSFLLLRR